MEKGKITIQDICLPENTILDHRYQILRVLGRGGFGITYEAINKRVNRRVAIKEFYSGEYMGREKNMVVLTDRNQQETFETVKKKFLREARILGDMSEEPGVVRVLDYFEENNTAYIVMDYVQGSSLGEYFRKKGRIEATQMFKILFPLMQTLDKIHKCGVIHRDITPENIKFVDNKETEVRLIDFGSARNLMNSTHTVELTDGYAPLEQYSGHEQGPWTDVYSLCAVAYQGITGNKPESAIFRVSNDNFIMPSQLGISIDPGLERILKKGLNLRKENRYQNVEELLAELEILLYPRKKEKYSKKGKIFLAVSCMIFTLTVGAAAGWKYYQDHLAYFKFHGKETETVLLVPYDDMGSQDYKKDTETIRKRLEYIAGDDGYILREREDGLEVTMPLEFFQKNQSEKYKDIDYNITQIMKNYITQPQKIAISVVEESDDGKGSGEYWWIDREDIISVRRKDGKMPVESRLSEEYTSDTKYDSYLEIKITENAAKKIRQDLSKEQLTERMYTILITDPGDVNRSKMQLETDFDGDWTTYYMNCNKDQKWWKALFKTPELSEAFQTVQEMPVVWEQKNGMWGKYQRQESEIQEPSVTSKYEVWLAGASGKTLKEGSGEWTEVMYDLKRELDTLEIPYAVGLPSDGCKKIIVKTAQEDTNIFLRESLLGGVSFSLTVEGSEVEEHSLSGGKIEFSEKPYELQYVTENDTQKERLKEWLSQVMGEGKTKIYLWMRGYRIAWTEIESDTTEQLRFSNSCLKSEGKFDKKELPFLKFVHEVYDVQNSNGFSYDGYNHSSEEQYSTAKQTVVANATVQNEKLMPESREFEEAEEMVKKINSKASLRESRTSAELSRLYIHLKYDLKKAYANKMVSDIERLLSEGMEELKKYSTIYIVPGDIETSSFICIQKDGTTGKWTLQYKYKSDKDAEEVQVREKIKNSTILKPYLTEESLKEDMGWWWYNYDFL